MISDPRFGLELYDEPAEVHDVGGLPVELVGHVWSPDAERIVRRPDGTVVVVDPSGANPTFLNSSLDATHAFVDAFARFYAVDHPAVASPRAAMTVDEARARLRELQEVDAFAVPAAGSAAVVSPAGAPPAGAVPAAEVPGRPPASAPEARSLREAALRAELAQADPDSLGAGSWWSRIMDGLAAGRY